MNVSRFRFGQCRGYAFLGVIDDADQFMEESGLRSGAATQAHTFARPRGLRFWAVHFQDGRNVDTGELLDDYYELSMAFLVDVDQEVGQRKCAAWHLPILYLDNSVAQEVGVREFGFPKRLAHMSLMSTDQSVSVEASDPDTDELLVRLAATNVWLEAASLEGLDIEGLNDPVDRQRVGDFVPACAQLLVVNETPTVIVAPQLEASMTHMSVATSARVKLDVVSPRAAAPFAWRFHMTSFVIRTQFSMELRLDDDVCPPPIRRPPA